MQSIRSSLLHAATALVAATATTAAAGSLAAAPATAAAPAAAPAEGHRVVLIIPGQSVGPLPYQPLRATLEGAGYDARVLDLDGMDVRADARSIGDEVGAVLAQDPEATVSLVGHSVGGISAREYLKVTGDPAETSRVTDYVAIGSPQYGSPGACAQPGAARDVCPGSELLAELNAGDDTPGATRYTSIRGEHEWTDGRLDGGQCRMAPIAPPHPLVNGGLHHSLEPVQPEVLGAVTAALDGTCTGEVVDEADGAILPEQTIFRDGI